MLARRYSSSSTSAMSARSSSIVHSFTAPKACWLGAAPEVMSRYNINSLRSWSMGCPVRVFASLAPMLRATRDSCSYCIALSAFSSGGYTSIGTTSSSSSAGYCSPSTCRAEVFPDCFRDCLMRVTSCFGASVFVFSQHLHVEGAQGGEKFTYRGGLSTLNSCTIQNSFNDTAHNDRTSASAVRCRKQPRKNRKADPKTFVYLGMPRPGSRCRPAHEACVF